MAENIGKGLKWLDEKDPGPKYKFTKEVRIIQEKKTGQQHRLYRIQAIRSFGMVHKDECGGWIEKETNLSQRDDCWVKDDAMVWGNARVEDQAIVANDAQIMDHAVICGMAIVEGHASVSGHAVISNYARVLGNAQIQDYAKIYGKAVVWDKAIVSEHALIYGYAVIERRAHVAGATEIRAETIVKDDRYYRKADDNIHGYHQRVVALHDYEPSVTMPRQGSSYGKNLYAPAAVMFEGLTSRAPIAILSERDIYGKLLFSESDAKDPEQHVNYDQLAETLRDPAVAETIRISLVDGKRGFSGTLLNGQKTFRIPFDDVQAMTMIRKKERQDPVFKEKFEQACRDAAMERNMAIDSITEQYVAGPSR